MSQQNSSRRSHRTVRISRRAQLALLGVSILVFVTGFGTLAWAIADVRADAARPGPAQEQQAQPGGNLAPAEAPDGQSGETSGEGEPEAGTLKSPEELVEDKEREQKSAKPTIRKKSTAQQGRKARKRAKDGKKEKTVQPAPRSEKKPKAKEKPKKRSSPERKAEQKTETAPEPKAEPTPSPHVTPQNTEKSPEPARRTVKIHHTAYRKITVYRTRHHKAASSIESETESDSPRREACPFCGKRHKHGFTERIFDHYEYKFCKACGKKHARSYTETVAAD